MAGKIRPMSQIKQLLQLHRQGYKVKFIARSLGISKNTVKTYLKKVALSGVEISVLLDLDDPVLESRFFAGNPAYLDDRFEDFKTRLDYFEKELARPHVTKRLLWQEYRQQYTRGYGYTQFCYHLSQQLVARKPSMVLTHKPGEKLFVDFAGDKLSYINRDTGEIIKCQVFVACLPYSDYGFAIAVKSQGIEDFLHALGCCLQELGGVPQVLVSDNLKSAIVKASSYEPEVSRAMEDFANHYNMAIVPARVRKPRDKALVENQVRLIYNRVYARLRDRQFFSLTELNMAIREYVRLHNQTRMQQKPYSRQEKFLAEEKALLGLLPQMPFELKYYCDLKVAKNNYIYLGRDKHYYSVPYNLTGQTVQVIYTRSMVRVYARGEQVALHQRGYRQGGYTTIKEHLCSHHQHYLQRSPEYYTSQALKKSETLSRLFDLMFADGRHPEQHYRSCDGLLSLCRKTGTETFENACSLAIELQNYSYRFVRNVIENKIAHQPQAIIEKPLPAHENIRGREYYKQITINF